MLNERLDQTQCPALNAMSLRRGQFRSGRNGGSFQRFHRRQSHSRQRIGQQRVDARPGFKHQARFIRGPEQFPEGSFAQCGQGLGFNLGRPTRRAPFIWRATAIGFEQALCSIRSLRLSAYCARACSSICFPYLPSHPVFSLVSLLGTVNYRDSF